MARRGRPAKNQSQPMTPLPVVPNSQTEKLRLNAGDVNPTGMTPNMKVDKQRKKERTTALVVRRSGRLNSHTRVDSVEPFVEEIIITEVENEDVVNQENNSHHETNNTPAMQPSPVEGTRISNLNYKTMYINSQKKVRSLMKKNKRLRKGLKFALGKIEGYDEMIPILSSLTKANEILCNRPGSIRKLRIECDVLTNLMLLMNRHFAYDVQVLDLEGK